MTQNTDDADAKRSAETKEQARLESGDNSEKVAKSAEVLVDDVSGEQDTATSDKDNMNQSGQPPTVIQPHGQISSSSSKGVAWLALFVGLVALAASGYAWYQTAVNAVVTGGAQTNRLVNVEAKVADFDANQGAMIATIDQIKERTSDSETAVAKQVSEVKQLVSTAETNLIAQVSEVRQQLAKTESNANELVNKLRSEMNSEQERVVSEVISSKQDLEAQTAAFRQEFETLSSSIGDLKAELGTSVEGWSLREIEHLLALANQRVQLGKDVVAAEQALSLADARLEGMNNSELVATRQAISSELAALNAVTPVDFIAVSGKLKYLEEALANLPMQGVAEISGLDKSTNQSVDYATDKPASAVDRVADVGRGFLTDLSELVQVEKSGESIVPSITPEIQAMNLTKAQLILEGARNALLQRHGEVFMDRLDAAEVWITKKFDTSEELTKSWLSELNALKNISIEAEYPDISGSLAAIRAVIDREG